MSILKEPIDFRALEAELDVALKADELYKLQNDAKIRAIEQRVPTYDDFRHMVQAAHLRPLDKSDTRKRAQASWNRCAVGVDEDSAGAVEARIAASKASSDEAGEEIDPLDPELEPRTSQDFVEYWHRVREPRKKLAYLVRFQERLKDRFFGGEVPTEFLEELFDCALEMIGDDDPERARRVRQLLGLLELLGQCRRFLLNLSMIENKTPIDRTFQRLYELVDHGSDTRQLQRFIFVASHYDMLLVPKATGIN